jgi:lipoprotein-anchoring transpeptidase ErfK/SrfK
MGKITTTVVVFRLSISNYHILTMPQFPTAAIVQAGLLLTTILAVMPTKIHAQSNPVPNSNLPTQTKIVTPQSPAIPAPAPATGVQKPATEVNVETKPAAGETVTAPTKPAANTVAPTVPGKSVTTNVPTPGAPKQPTATPVTTPGTNSATKQPHVGEAISLVLRLKEKKVYVYKGDQVLAKYPVAIGKKSTPTVTGEWYVMEKIANPGWTNFNTGKFVKPGPKNPMGERWIGFYTDGKDMIGFHGTPDVKSVGKAVSNGCVRMFNKDVKAIFPLVEVGTVVKVVNE